MFFFYCAFFWHLWLIVRETSNNTVVITSIFILDMLYNILIKYVLKISLKGFEVYCLEYTDWCFFFVCVRVLVLLWRFGAEVAPAPSACHIFISLNRGCSSASELELGSPDQLTRTGAARTLERDSAAVLLTGPTPRGEVCAQPRGVFWGRTGESAAVKLLWQEGSGLRWGMRASGRRPDQTCWVTGTRTNSTNPTRP